MNKKNKTKKHSHDTTDWNELDYLTESASEYIYEEIIKNFNFIFKHKENLIRRFFCFALYAILHSYALLFLTSGYDFQKYLSIIYTINTTILFTYGVYIHKTRRWGYHHATPSLILNLLHDKKDEQEEDLRLIKQRYLKLLDEMHETNWNLLSKMSSAYRKMLYSFSISNLMFLIFTIYQLCKN